jgi:hypothetical protein
MALKRGTEIYKYECECDVLICVTRELSTVNNKIRISIRLDIQSHVFWYIMDQIKSLIRPSLLPLVDRMCCCCALVCYCCHCWYAFVEAADYCYGDAFISSPL